MIYAVNHTMHSLHTIRAGSKTETALTARFGNAFERKGMTMGGHNYSVFTDAGAARDFCALLSLHGGL